MNFLLKLIWIGITLVVFLPISAQTIQEEALFGRKAVVIENDLMRVSSFPGGGYIGEVRFKTDDPLLNVNPMRVPHYQTIEPQDYVDEMHDSLYGDGGDKKVMAGYMGHFLCFPYLGGLSHLERDQGLGVHGEAVVTEWKVKWGEGDERGEGREARGEGGESAVLRMSVDLLKSRYRIERTLTMVDGESVVYVEETAENLVTFDRPFQWVQHTTFGEPFVEAGKNFVDAPAIAPAWNQDAELYRKLYRKMWSKAEDLDGQMHDLRAMEIKAGEGTYRAWLLDDSGEYTWFTMYHTEYQVLIGYLMPAEWNPWIGDWQENKFKSHAPWNSKAVARGILIGTSPFTGGIRRSIEVGPLYEKDTVRWIGAAESISQNYTIFLAKIPIGYQGTESLTVVERVIHLEERNTRRLISIKASRLEP